MIQDDAHIVLRSQVIRKTMHAMKTMSELHPESDHHHHDYHYHQDNYDHHGMIVMLMIISHDDNNLGNNDHVQNCADYQFNILSIT